ncbi:hypothetical protein LTR97_000021 [Elasticomyces elasticus]|uniref:Enoyl reductase (ER) domain-containing protein n=1 Tax=Elasticomyces elasticus TaxID=574655 RepID=A0AAN7WDQ7_9PEZI|nr:hypothetical protein LTR97_000021 [Elasticomyces elasticus]
MAPNIPTTSDRWTARQERGKDGLQLDRNAVIPPIGPTSCLIKMAAVSLNYRDVAMMTGAYPGRFKGSMVPCSDGAGTIIAIGSNVSLYNVGDRVCTLFSQGHQSGFVTPAIRETTLGNKLDGVLRRHAVFDETGLVAVPKSLSLIEATLTAWNALFGLEGRRLKAGDAVLAQGTGGVSLFAMQLALAAGATVIATTSSDTKAEKLRRELGVQHVVNYKTNEHWGETARGFTLDQEGAHHIIEVGGENSMQQSLKALRAEGVISIVGFLGGKPLAGQELCSFTDVLFIAAIVRGINIGSKEQFVAMNGFIDQHGIKPVVDGKVFRFEEAKEAYQYLLDQKQWGKVVISFD